MVACDATLVRGVLDGDRSAFAELYDRRARLIRAICYDTTRNLDEAADLTQEVFFRAYRGLHELRDHERFAAWLAGIARQVCREWRRGRLLRESRFMKWAEASKLRDLANESHPEDRLVELRDAITLLPERERLALHTFYLQEQDAEQARTVLGLSQSGFYRVLANARRRLGLLLQQQEASS